MKLWRSIPCCFGGEPKASTPAGATGAPRRTSAVAEERAVDAAEPSVHESHASRIETINAAGQRCSSTAVPAQPDAVPVDAPTRPSPPAPRRSHEPAAPHSHNDTPTISPSHARAASPLAAAASGSPSSFATSDRYPRLVDHPLSGDQLPLHHPGPASEPHAAGRPPFRLDANIASMADAAAMAVATVARLSPMHSRSLSIRQRTTAAGTRPPSSLAAASQHSPVSLSAAGGGALSLPLLHHPLFNDDSSTVSIPTEDDGDDGLPSPSDTASPAAPLAASRRSRASHGPSGGRGLGAHAEEAAFIRGTLAALKQATLAGFEEAGKGEVLPGLPRAQARHSSNRLPVLGGGGGMGLGPGHHGVAVGPGMGMAGGGAASGASSMGAPAARMALSPQVHEANLAALLGSLSGIAGPTSTGLSGAGMGGSGPAAGGGGSGLAATWSGAGGTAGGEGPRSAHQLPLVGARSPFQVVGPGLAGAGGSVGGAGGSGGGYNVAASLLASGGAGDGGSGSGTGGGYGVLGRDTNATLVTTGRASLSESWSLLGGTGPAAGPPWPVSDGAMPPSLAVQQQRRQEQQQQQQQHQQHMPHQQRASLPRDSSGAGHGMGLFSNAMGQQPASGGGEVPGGAAGGGEVPGGAAGGGGPGGGPSVSGPLDDGRGYADVLQEIFQRALVQQELMRLQQQHQGLSRTPSHQTVADSGMAPSLLQPQAPNPWAAQVVPTAGPGPVAPANMPALPALPAAAWPDPRAPAGVADVAAGLQQQQQQHQPAQHGMPALHPLPLPHIFKTPPAPPELSPVEATEGGVPPVDRLRLHMSGVSATSTEPLVSVTLPDIVGAALRAAGSSTASGGTAVGGGGGGGSSTRAVQSGSASGSAQRTPSHLQRRQASEQEGSWSLARPRHQPSLGDLQPLSGRDGPVWQQRQQQQQHTQAAPAPAPPHPSLHPDPRPGPGVGPPAAYAHAASAAQPGDDPPLHGGGGGDTSSESGPLSLLQLQLQLHSQQQQQESEQQEQQQEGKVDSGSGAARQGSAGAGEELPLRALPPAAVAAESEVAAFAQELGADQRLVLEQLVRDKWSPFSFPLLAPPSAAGALGTTPAPGASTGVGSLSSGGTGLHASGPWSGIPMAPAVSRAPAVAAPGALGAGVFAAASHSQQGSSGGGMAPGPLWAAGRGSSGGGAAFPPGAAPGLSTDAVFTGQNALWPGAAVPQQGQGSAAPAFQSPAALASHPGHPYPHLRLDLQPVTEASTSAAIATATGGSLSPTPPPGHPFPSSVASTNGPHFSGGGGGDWSQSTAGAIHASSPATTATATAPWSQTHAYTTLTSTTHGHALSVGLSPHTSLSLSTASRALTPSQSHSRSQSSHVSQAVATAASTVASAAPAAPRGMPRGDSNASGTMTAAATAAARALLRADSVGTSAGTGTPGAGGPGEAGPMQGAGGGVEVGAGTGMGRGQTASGVVGSSAQIQTKAHGPQQHQPWQGLLSDGLGAGGGSGPQVPPADSSQPAAVRGAVVPPPPEPPSAAPPPSGPAVSTSCAEPLGVAAVGPGEGGAGCTSAGAIGNAMPSGLDGAATSAPAPSGGDGGNGSGGLAREDSLEQAPTFSQLPDGDRALQVAAAAAELEGNPQAQPYDDGGGDLVLHAGLGLGEPYVPLDVRARLPQRAGVLSSEVAAHTTAAPHHEPLLAAHPDPRAYPDPAPYPELHPGPMRGNGGGGGGAGGGGFAALADGQYAPLTGADLAVVQSMVARRWSPFFEMAAALESPSPTPGMVGSGSPVPAYQQQQQYGQQQGGWRSVVATGAVADAGTGDSTAWVSLHAGASTGASTPVHDSAGHGGGGGRGGGGGGANPGEGARRPSLGAGGSFADWSGRQQAAATAARAAHGHGAAYGGGRGWPPPALPPSSGSVVAGGGSVVASVADAADVRHPPGGAPQPPGPPTSAAGQVQQLGGGLQSPAQAGQGQAAASLFSFADVAGAQGQERGQGSTSPGERGGGIGGGGGLPQRPSAA